MCGAAGAARSAKSCSRSGLGLLGLFADADQFRARRLGKYKAIPSNELVEGGLYDRNLQLMIVAWAGDVDLPGVVKLAERVPWLRGLAPKELTAHLTEACPLYIANIRAYQPVRRESTKGGAG